MSSSEINDRITFCPFFLKSRSEDTKHWQSLRYYSVPGMILSDSDELTQLASHLGQETLLLPSLSHRQDTETGSFSSHPNPHSWYQGEPGFESGQPDSGNHVAFPDQLVLTVHYSLQPRGWALPQLQAFSFLSSFILARMREHILQFFLWSSLFLFSVPYLVTFSPTHTTTECKTRGIDLK